MATDIAGPRCPQKAVARHCTVSLSRLFGLFAGILFITNIELAYHSISGMETTFALFCITLFCVSAAAMLLQPKKKTAFFVAFVGILCGLTRPEMNAAVLSAMVVCVFVATDKKTVLKFCLLPYLWVGRCHRLCIRISY